MRVSVCMKGFLISDNYNYNKNRVVLIFFCRLAGDENNHGLAMKRKIGTEQDFRDSRDSTKKKLPGGLTALISTSIIKIGVIVSIKQ